MAQIAVSTLAEVFKGTSSAAGTDLYNYLKRWFQGNPRADQALEDAKQNPSSFLPAVEHYVTQMADQNEDFRKGLVDLVEQLQPSESSSIVISQSKNVGVSTGQSSVSINVTENSHNNVEKDKNP